MAHTTSAAQILAFMPPNLCSLHDLARKPRNVFVRQGCVLRKPCVVIDTFILKGSFLLFWVYGNNAF